MNTPKLMPRLSTYAKVAVGSAVATALVTALLVNIVGRKHEERVPFVRLVEVGEDDVDPAKWGTNWPRQYDGYRRTEEATATKYGGGLIGPEGTLPPQKAEKDPWLTRLFAGYLFAVDYRDRRGHAHMLHDQEVTKRNVPGENKQSGNCLHCHASVLPLYRKLGREKLPEGNPTEQVRSGLEQVGAMSYWDAHAQLGQVTSGPHPVSCVDCHDPATLELRATRPGFLMGMEKLAASDSPVPHLPSVERWRQGPRTRPYDANTDGTRQELRSFVCGQCHVEYFCGKATPPKAGSPAQEPSATIFFPWDGGLRVEEIERTYDGMQAKGGRFKDWVHAETGMPVLKAQHPEFEVWSQGVHARSGVACADCHMPYKREGAMKVSEHWLRSPLLQINRACGACHAHGETELAARVTTIQDRHHALMTRAGKAAVAMLDAIVVVRRGWEAGQRERVTAEARAALAAAPDFAGLAPDQQQQRLEAEVKARLATAWTAAVAGDAALTELAALQRAAQWRLDFVAAENSMGFHAPQELARILGESIDLARQAEVAAVRLAGGAPPAAMAPSPPGSAAAPGASAAPAASAAGSAAGSPAGSAPPATSR